MSKSRLIIIRGLPGSGKSTFAKSYFNGHTHLEADMYFVQPDGSYYWVVEQLGKAHSWCLETTKIMLNNGQDVVVSNTFTTLKELEPYVNFAKSNDIPYGVFRMETQYESIHRVPVEAIERMKARFQDFNEEIYHRDGIAWQK